MFVNFNILNQLGSPAINSNTFANRPAAGQTGRLFVSTDTYEIYRDNGTTWDLIGGPGSSTITGTGTATQVAYFTSSQAIGSSANLFWDNTSGFLGVATATPSARIEAVKTDGIGIYANFTTNAGSGSSTTALWAKNVTNSSGFAAVIEETTPNTTAGQYPLLIKHSLSSGTAGVGMGTGLHFQLPDDAGTFKTTQLTIETINAAAATYATRYRFNVQSNGSSTPVAYINATGVGIFTATPGAALDVHSTGTIAQFNTTSATGNTYIAFQRTGTGLWRIGDTYNGGNNFFELHNTVLGVDAMEFEAATNKSTFQAQQTYTTGQARGNYFDYNLSVAAGGSFSSPNAITALGASLDLTLAGNATIPSGARSGLDAYNTIAFTGAGTLTHNQGTQIRAYSNLTAGWAFNGSATGTITHLAGLRALFPDNTGSAIAITNNYALLLNDQTANTGTVTYTNRWGVYQEGASDLNYFAANTLINTTTNSGYKLDVNGTARIASNLIGERIQVGAASNINDVPGVANTLQLANYTLGTFISGSADCYIYKPANVIAGLSSQTLVFQTRSDVAGGGFAFVSGTTPSVIASISSSGNTTISGTLIVGGTSSYGATLTVYGSSTLSGGIGLRNSAGTAAGFFGTYAAGSGSGSTDIAIDSVGFINMSTGGSERIRVTSTGLVGIGTNTPAGILHAQATNSGIVFDVTTAYTPKIKASGTLSDIQIESVGNGGNVQLNAPGASSITFSTNGGEAARFTSTKNLLIGTTTDNGNKLQIRGSATMAQPDTPTLLLTHDNTSKTLLFGVDDLNVFLRANSTNSILFQRAGGINALKIYGNTGVAEFESSISTGVPSGGTAANWKLGTRVAATVVLDTTQYIQLDVNGTLYKLAIVT